MIYLYTSTEDQEACVNISSLFQPQASVLGLANSLAASQVTKGKQGHPNFSKNLNVRHPKATASTDLSQGPFSAR